MPTKLWKSSNWKELSPDFVSGAGDGCGRGTRLAVAATPLGVGVLCHRWDADMRDPAKAAKAHCLAVGELPYA